MSLKLSIVIPAYNEETRIPRLLDKVKNVQLIDQIQKEIIIVNDGSHDGTAEVVQRYIAENSELEIKYFEHDKNRGKGAALHTAIPQATGDFLVIQDADLEYDPNEYNELLKPILMGEADIVYGSRFSGNKPQRVLFFWHTVGNKVLTWFSNIFNNLDLDDIETCYKCFKTDVIQNLKLKEKGFGFEPEVTAKIAKIKNIRIFQVGISYYGRTYEEGKKITWKDGLRSFYCIVRYGVFD
ncbi:glycosyltransferase [candidate division KSB1 bacterium]|nr:glycosyltransferase [candidate division KSB1 bacterium]